MKYEIADQDMRHILVALMFTTSPDVCIDTDDEYTQNSFNTLDKLSRQVKNKKFDLSNVEVHGTRNSFEEKTIYPKIKRIIKKLKK